ncbi:MAG TPA: glycine zipper domain-containing protein [Humisphaera sp.]
MSKSYASRRLVRTLAGSILLPVAAAGCATKTQTGLLVGGAGGAAAGAAIGSASGNAGKGALIGGAVGLVGGGLIGHAADKSDEADRERATRQEADRRAAEQRAGEEQTGARAADRRPTEAYASAGDVGYGSYAPPRDTAAARGNRVTREQVVQWTQAGVRDDIIVDRIERSDTVFRMTAADERDLRQQGVSETVLMAMRDTARR